MFLCSLLHIDVAALDLQGPVFSHEPPHKIEFSNNTGGHIECSGHGSPQPEVCTISITINDFSRADEPLY